MNPVKLCLDLCFLQITVSGSGGPIFRFSFFYFSLHFRLQQSCFAEVIIKGCGKNKHKNSLLGQIYSSLTKKNKPCVLTKYADTATRLANSKTLV